ncbi:MAG: hypothetical protein GX097_06985 [Methanomicrobiales archaeon]|jgi:hypothetical protein|nr:hypothetical protein [Methanomicrobiales archaeon]
MERSIKTDEEGMVGIEVAIILITAIVAASVLSLAILHLGDFSAEKTRAVAQGGIGQVGTSISTVGPLLGVERGGSLGAFRVTFAIPAGSRMVDFTALRISVATPDAINVIPAADPLIQGSPEAGTWSIIRQMPDSPENDLFLENNERFTVEVSLPIGQEVPVKGEYVLSIILSEGGVWKKSGVAPSKTDPLMILS